MADYNDRDDLRDDEFDERRRMSNDERRLFPLDELDDYEVADDDPDIRGWKVLGADGQKIGEVEELIVDPELLKVRYVDVVADDELNVGEDERHLLIPIGALTLDDDDDNVKVSNIDRKTLEHYPVYKGGPITYDFEHSLRESYLSQKLDRNPEATGSDMYKDDMYNENRVFETRRRTMGRDMTNDAGYIRRRDMNDE